MGVPRGGGGGASHNTNRMGAKWEPVSSTPQPSPHRDDMEGWFHPEWMRVLGADRHARRAAGQCVELEVDRDLGVVVEVVHVEE